MSSFLSGIVFLMNILVNDMLAITFTQLFHTRLLCFGVYSVKMTLCFTGILVPVEALKYVRTW